MLGSKVDDPQTMELIEETAAGMVHSIDTFGMDSVQDWEVDELLDWTTTLNFDE